MCNQPTRLVEALLPVRADLVAPGPISRWGMGYIRGGEVLLSRTPRRSNTELDFFPLLGDLKTDCLIAHAAYDADTLATESTQPFRFRRWMFAQDSAPLLSSEDWNALIEHIPEFLRRSLRGRTIAELTLHVLLAALHDQNVMDEPTISLLILRRSLAATLDRMNQRLIALGRSTPTGNVAVSNGRSLLIARVPGGDPLFVRRLHVLTDRGLRDDSFRGVLALSSGHAPGEGAEEVPSGSIVMISRDLRVDIAPTGAA